MDEEQKRLAEELLFTEKKSKSFAKCLYFGSFEEAIAFPYPDVKAAEQKPLDELIKNVQKFAEDSIDPDWIDKHAQIPSSVISGLGKLGVLGVTIPKAYGGLAMSQHAYCKVAEIIARRCASTALFINAHQSIGLKALLLFGTEQQRSKWLTPLAKGEEIAAFSLTEPNAGSDAAGIETRAVYDPKNRTYIINGKKQWTTNGSIAQVLTVMAKTEVETSSGKQDKVTAFLITPDIPGFKIVAPALEKVGMRGTRTTNLEFQNMVVPEDRVLGPVGGGLKVCLTVLDYGRTTFGATCTGAAKFLVEAAIKHAKSRYQFNRPLSSFSLVKKKIAYMAALAYAMDASTYFTAGLIDRGLEDIMLESAMLKVFTSEALWSILYDTMQIYGGRSFFTDYPFERMMRDARLNMIGEGSNEVLKAFIGAVGMRDVGLGLQSYLKAFHNPIAQWSILRKLPVDLIRRVRLPEITLKSPSLKIEASQLSKAVRRFGYSVVRLLGHYRENIVEKQLELERIANSAIAIYTATAVLSKLDADYIKNKADVQELSCGKMYCQMAFESINVNLNALFSTTDDAVENLSDRLTKDK
jgi:acyl-CoA dehydrogenase family member 9